jgi:peptide subunit release factor 1 (eRF1)
MKGRGLNTLLSPHHESLLRFEGIRSGSTPVLSVYLNFPSDSQTGGSSARLRDQLGPIKSFLESEGFGHAAAMGLRSGIDRAFELEPTLEKHRGHGWGFFFCEALELDEQVLVPARVWDCAMVSSTPYLRPLRAALDGFRRVATVVVDGRRADVVVSCMGEVLDRRTIRAEVVRKSNRAGWHGLDEHRNRQHAEEVRKRLWRDITETVEELRIDFGIEAIFVGGQHTATEGLVDFFRPEIQSLVGTTFNPDLHSISEAQLLAEVASLEEVYARQREKDLVLDTYETAAVDGWAVVGIEEVTEAVNRQAVGELLIQHGVVVEGRVCPQCARLDASERVCRECESFTTEVGDIFDVVATAVSSTGGEVVHVSADTALATDLIAARLRFPLY